MLLYVFVLFSLCREVDWSLCLVHLTVACDFTPHWERQCLHLDLCRYMQVCKIYILL